MMIQKSKLVSVVMSVYSEPLFFVKQSIDSVLKQIYTHLEFIIINDNPKDEAIDSLIKSYSDCRIRYYRNIENLGLAGSLNVGIKLAKGEFIARMDADDISFSTRLKAQVDFLNFNPDIYIVGGYAVLIDERGNEIGVLKSPLGYEKIKVNTLLSVPFIHPTVMFRTVIFSKYVMYYNEAYSTAQDFELWTRIVNNFESANIPKHLIKYRKSENQISTSKIHEQTEFFLTAVVKQFNYLGIEITNEERNLVKLITRNIDNQPISIDEIILIRKFLIIIYEKIITNKNYEKKILTQHFLIWFSNTFTFFNGTFFKFHKELVILENSLGTSIFTRIIFRGYLLKIKIKIYLISRKLFL